jgi:predicted nucleic acid-binding protein
LVLVVADAGPLIYLSSLGHLDLLRSLHDQVLIPEQVWAEVVERGAGLPGSTEVAAAHWLQRHRVDPSDPIMLGLAAALDMGEAAAISLATLHRADLLLIDERRGRAAARRLGITVQGTLGVLVRAKRARLILDVRSALGRLRAVGFRIDSAIEQQVLREAGEFEP